MIRTALSACSISCSSLKSDYVHMKEIAHNVLALVGAGSPR